LISIHSKFFCHIFYCTFRFFTFILCILSYMNVSVCVRVCLENWKEWKWKNLQWVGGWKSRLFYTCAYHSHNSHCVLLLRYFFTTSFLYGLPFRRYLFIFFAITVCERYFQCMDIWFIFFSFFLLSLCRIIEKGG
jgi:hypothetical protein